MKTVRIVLEVLKAAFKQDDLWRAITVIVENRGKIKMAKLNLWITEAADLREIEYDIKEEKAKRRLEKQKKKNKQILTVRNFLFISNYFF